MASERTPLVGAAPAPAAAPPRRRTLKAALGICGLVIALCVMAAIVVGYSPGQSGAHSVLTPGVDPNSMPFGTAPHPEKPSALWGSLARPYPTGAWWTNLAVGKGNQQAVAHPYAFKASDQGLEVSYSAYRRVASATTVVDIFAADWTLGAAAGTVDHYMVRYDLLTAHVYFVCAEAGSLKALLAKGSPYATVEYTRATPQLTPLAAIIKINGESVGESTSHSTLVSGQRFEVGLSNGMRWLVYASAPVAFNVNKDALTAAETFKGMIRIAHVPSGGCGHDLVPLLDAYAGGVPVAASLRVDYAFATAANASFGGGEGPHSAILTHSYTVAEWEHWSEASTSSGSNHSLSSYSAMASRGNRGQGKRSYDLHYTSTTDNLLMLGLPHHFDVATDSSVQHASHSSDSSSTSTSSSSTSTSGTSLPKPKSDLCMVDGVYTGHVSIKGPLRPKVGSRWELTQELLPASFSAPRAPSMEHDHASVPNKDALIAALTHDVGAVPVDAVDSYNFGKQVARLAQLLMVTKEYNKALSGNAELQQVHDDALEKLEAALEKWLEPMSGKDSPLVYDDTYGGIVTSAGIADQRKDYGNGWYNDHHFHYGYIIYAAAVVATVDDEWTASHRAAVAALIRDVAAILPLAGGETDLGVSQPVGDPLFPTARHKDWFDWHSWASGIVPQGNGKSQESSSEAVHAYWAVALYGTATNDKQLSKWGRLLLSMETRAAKTYYQIPRTSVVYEAPFSANRMVGNLGAADAVASTWFGDKPEYVHGIQAIPITPFTEYLFEPHFVEQEMPMLVDALTREEQPVQPLWQGILAELEAVVDPKLAAAALANVDDFGIGGSASQAYYWLLTRPRWGSANEFDVEKERKANAAADKRPKQCALVTACRVLGLQGSCCPGDDGVLLGCCPME